MLTSKGRDSVGWEFGFFGVPLASWMPLAPDRWDVPFEKWICLALIWAGANRLGCGSLMRSADARCTKSGFRDSKHFASYLH